MVDGRTVDIVRGAVPQQVAGGFMPSSSRSSRARAGPMPLTNFMSVSGAMGDVELCYLKVEGSVILRFIGSPSVRAMSENRQPT